jgi:hypothetical protein
MDFSDALRALKDGKVVTRPESKYVVMAQEWRRENTPAYQTAGVDPLATLLESVARAEWNAALDRGIIEVEATPYSGGTDRPVVFKLTNLVRRLQALKRKAPTQ